MLHKNLTGAPVRLFVILAVTLLLSPTSLSTQAAPPGPGRTPAGGRGPTAVNRPPRPAPAGAGHRPGINPPPNHPRPNPRPDVRPRPPLRPLDRPAFWYPTHGPLPSKQVWTAIGYPYYVGTPGDALPLRSSGESVGTDSADRDSESAAPGGSTSEGPYLQMQELIDLIHAWRTLNESPALHERLESLVGASEADPKLDAFRSANRSFDTASRKAMSRLVAGESAEEEVASAAEALQQVMQLAESLPAPGTRPAD